MPAEGQGIAAASDVAASEAAVAAKGEKSAGVTGATTQQKNHGVDSTGPVGRDGSTPLGSGSVDSSKVEPAAAGGMAAERLTGASGAPPLSPPPLLEGPAGTGVPPSQQQQQQQPEGEVVAGPGSAPSEPPPIRDEDDEEDDEDGIMCHPEGPSLLLLDDAGGLPALDSETIRRVPRGRPGTSSDRPSPVVIPVPVPPPVPPSASPAAPSVDAGPVPGPGPASGIVPSVPGGSYLDSLMMGLWAGSSNRPRPAGNLFDVFKQVGGASFPRFGVC